MFDNDSSLGSLAVLAALKDTLAHLDVDDDDRVRIDQLRLLEEIKATAAAAQARVTAAFVASQRRGQSAAGVPAEQVGRGIAAQVALALRTSPFRAQRYCGWATILTAELPRTLEQLCSGRVTEWRAMLVARETATLTREHRAIIDAALAPRLESLGDRQAEAETRAWAYRLDPVGFINRTRGADNDRHVSLRPAPDTMTRLTGFLPVAQGVAAYAALVREADTRQAVGDPRGRGQIMADTLVQRLTGQTTATGVPVEVNIVIGVDTLLNGDDDPAHLHGYGPIPAHLARTLATGGTNTSDESDRHLWIRRLFTHPTDGSLVQMETHRRRFTTAQRRFIALRDQTCRTPWCDAPIRHTDHVTTANSGGPTALTNAQGLCQACNHTKQGLGWLAHPQFDGTTATTTPTGHCYRSRPPDLPGRRRRTQWTRPRSPVERHLRSLLHAA